MKVSFTRWCLDPKGRTTVTVESKRVDCVEHFGEAFHAAATSEYFPACSKIIMQGKQEYLVQGSVEAVTRCLWVGDRE